MKRRDFIKLGIVGAASAAAGLSGLKEVAKAANVVSGFPPAPVYRTLGRTGLKITIVSFGAMLTPEYEVMEAAFELGVNYVDTARRYMNGRNEEIVAKALKGRRDKVFVATKTQPGSVTKKDLFRDVETSLSKLQTDHIDVIQLHNLDNGNKQRIFVPETREALLELRKQGKVRFFGVTTHTNQVDILNALTGDPQRFFDTALVGYNFKSGPELKEAIARAAKAGIGIVAMKTQAGGYKTDALGPLSPHQAALKWVLQDINVTTAIPGMKDMSMLQEDLSVMGVKMTALDARILDRYSRAVEGYYCHLCAECEPTCPQNVSISVVNRCLMYGEGYGNWDLARSTYREMSPESTASLCVNCGECVARCVHGLDISMKMNKARTFFA
jgi:predicted aldo/keto reductase-like oxidoreductase